MEGEYGQDIGNELNNSSKKISNAVDSVIDKAVDKAVDKAMDKHKDLFSGKKNSLGNKDGININKNNPNKVAEAADAARKRGIGAAKAADVAKNAVSKAGQSIANGAANGAIDRAVDAMAGPRADDSQTGGAVMNEITDGTRKIAKDAAKVAAAAGKLVATGGTDPAAWADILKIIGKIIAKILLFIVAIIAGLIFIIIFLFKELIGNVISDAITFISEGFQNIANALNPTVIEEFTMEKQYEILALAFQDEVMYAYDQLLEEVEGEIDKYNKNLIEGADYNSWRQGLEYSKAHNIIDYNHIVERTDEVILDEKKVGMPINDDGTMTKVYVGGFNNAGSYNESDFVDGYGPSNYLASKNLVWWQTLKRRLSEKM